MGCDAGFDLEPRWSVGDVEGDVWFAGDLRGAVGDGGTVAIADRGSQRITFLTVEGEVLRVAGGPGEGPGEYRALRWVASGRGLFAAYDRRLNRLTYYDGAGEITGSVPVPGGHQAVGILLDGRPVLMKSLNSPRAGGPVVWAETVQVAVLGGGGLQIVASRYPGPRRFVDLERSFTIIPVPYTPHPRALGGDSVLVLLDGERMLLRYPGAPADTPSVEVPLETRPLPDEWRELHRERRLRDASDRQRPQIRRTSEAMPYPEQLPRYEDGLLDPHGAVWLQIPTEPSAPHAYAVVDTSGTLLGRVRLGTGETLLALGRHLVLVERTGTGGVPLVVAHARGPCPEPGDDDSGTES